MHFVHWTFTAVWSSTVTADGGCIITAGEDPNAQLVFVVVYKYRHGLLDRQGLLRVRYAILPLLLLHGLVGVSMVLVIHGLVGVNTAH